jgi:hypothetical protein
MANSAALLEALVWPVDAKASEGLENKLLALDDNELLSLLRLAYSEKVMGEVSLRSHQIRSEYKAAFFEAHDRGIQWSREVLGTLTDDCVLLKGASVQLHYVSGRAQRFGSDIDVWVPSFSALVALEERLALLGLKKSEGYAVRRVTGDQRGLHIVARSSPVDRRPGFRGVEIHANYYPVYPGGFLGRAWIHAHHEARSIYDRQVRLLSPLGLTKLLVADRADLVKPVTFRDLIDLESLVAALASAEASSIIDELRQMGNHSALARYQARYDRLQWHVAPSHVQSLLEAASRGSTALSARRDRLRNRSLHALEGCVDYAMTKFPRPFQRLNRNARLVRALHRLGVAVYVQRNDAAELVKTDAGDKLPTGIRSSLRPS